MRFTHPSISFEIAFALGINSKREQKVEECSKPMEIYSKDFGQHEELVTRIKTFKSFTYTFTVSSGIGSDPCLL
jgi:hypothetical protein